MYRTLKTLSDTLASKASVFEQPTSVPEIALERGAEEEPLYNLAGQRVDKSYRSIVVKKGRKLLVK